MRISDWSSDVCSSDLVPGRGAEGARDARAQPRPDTAGAGTARVRDRAAAALAAKTVVAAHRPAHSTPHARPGRRPDADKHAAIQIGREACRERVCQYG